jgi:cell division protein FtsI (penicillin-binding protein 3)
VLIKNPRGWYQYGSNVAAPVFKEIADNIYSRDLNLHQAMEKKTYVEPGVFPVIRAGNQEELTMLCNELGISNHSLSEEDWVRASRNGSAVNWKKNTVGLGLVPDVMGMTFRDALFLLEQSGLRVFYEGKGRVKKQSMIPGRRIARGEQIFIELG